MTTVKCFYSDRFDQWIRSRISVEQVMPSPSAPPVRNQRLGLLLVQEDSSSSPAHASSITTTGRRAAAEALALPVSTTTDAAGSRTVPLLDQRKPSESLPEFERQRRAVYSRRSLGKERQQEEQARIESQSLQCSPQRGLATRQSSF